MIASIRFQTNMEKNMETLQHVHKSLEYSHNIMLTIPKMGKHHCLETYRVLMKGELLTAAACLYQNNFYADTYDNNGMLNKYMKCVIYVLNNASVIDTAEEYLLQSLKDTSLKIPNDNEEYASLKDNIIECFKHVNLHLSARKSQYYEEKFHFAIDNLNQRVMKNFELESSGQAI